MTILVQLNSKFMPVSKQGCGLLFKILSQTKN